MQGRSELSCSALLVLLPAIIRSISASKPLNFILAVLCVGPQIGVLEKQSLSFPVGFFYCFVNLMLIKYFIPWRDWDCGWRLFTKERNHHSTCVWMIHEGSCRNLGSWWHRASTTYGSSSALLNGFFFNMRSYQEWEKNSPYACSVWSMLQCANKDASQLFAT